MEQIKNLTFADKVTNVKKPLHLTKCSGGIIKSTTLFPQKKWKAGRKCEGKLTVAKCVNL